MAKNMTYSKNKFKEATKGMQNTVRVIEGVTIAHVRWKNYPWMIIKNGETFEDACHLDFIPIQSFSKGDDLYNAIYKSND